MFILNINKMTNANRSKVVRRRTRRRETNRRGGGGAAASASRRSSRRSDRPPTHCDWRVISSMVDREDMDIHAFDDNNEPLHPSVHFNDIVGKNGHIKNRHLRHALRQTCNQQTMDMIVQRDIPRVTHVSRSGRLLSFFHDGVCVGSVTVAPIGRVPAWMIINPTRSPGGTEFPRWVTTSPFVPTDADDVVDDNNGPPPPPVDLREIVGKNGEITQASLRAMLHDTGNQGFTKRLPVQGITNVTHVKRFNTLLEFFNNDIHLGHINVRAMGQRQPSWMIMPR